MELVGRPSSGSRASGGPFPRGPSSWTGLERASSCPASAPRRSRKLRQLVPAEQVAVLKVADQVAAAPGNRLLERMNAVGIGVER